MRCNEEDNSILDHQTKTELLVEHLFTKEQQLYNPRIRIFVS